VPTPREQLANILRQSRLNAGYESHGALAKRLNVSRPVVTRAENAAHPVPSDAVLVAWAGATGAGLDTLTDLAQRAKSGTPDWFMPYRHAESGARILRYWSPIVVPGVAQTSGYMRALFEDEGHLLDQVRDRMDFPATCRAVEAVSKKWPQATLKLIEDKANGPAVIAQLRQKVPGMVPVDPKGSKQARAHAVTAFVEAGNVFLPAVDRAPWVAGFVVECSAFPTGAHDDQVDAMTQALLRLSMVTPQPVLYVDPAEYERFSQISPI